MDRDHQPRLVAGARGHGAPPSTDAAIRLDTEALAKAALECDRDIRGRSTGHADTPDQSARRQVFEMRRGATVATPEYLRVLGLASRAQDRTLGLVNAHGAVRIAGVEATEPTIIANALLVDRDIPDYYGLFVFDPDGMRVEVACAPVVDLFDSNPVSATSD